MPSCRVAWISGWSVPAASLLEAARIEWPDARHTVFDPNPGAVAATLASDADLLGGFSFGAHLLLGVEDPRPRILLAPFPDLKKETGLGGAVATTQIRHLLRWLKRDPRAAIADFHARIGTEPPPLDILPSLEDLAWGLERMLAPGSIPPPLPQRSLAVAGQRDPLLDADALRGLFPSLLLIDAGHQPKPLLAAAVRLRHTAPA